MKFSAIAIVGTMLANRDVSAFAPVSAPRTNGRAYVGGSKLSMALDMPDAPETSQVASTEAPAIQSKGGAPVDPVILIS